MRWWAILLVLGLALGASAQDVIQCANLNGQKKVDMNELKGDWYSIETILHKSSQQTNDLTQVNKIKIPVCPRVELTPFDINGSPKIRMIWKENDGTIEYNFWVATSVGSGVWNCDTKQNGTMTEKPAYIQFVGTVHVMKAVASNVLLTFCSRSGPEFSFLLGRPHKLPNSDIKGARNLLQYRKIPLTHIRETCRNTATRSTGSVLLGLSMLIVLWKNLG